MRRDPRRVGRRQVDAAPRARHPRSPERRQRPLRRARPVRRAARRAGALPQRVPRLRVPVPPPAARVQRRRERDDAGPAARPRAAPRCARAREAILEEVGLSDAAATIPSASSRAASASASRWRARWCSTRCWCWPTSRPATSTRRPASASRELLLELNRTRGAALVVVTHSLELAARLGRAERLVDGRLRPEASAPAPALPGASRSRRLRPNSPVFREKGCREALASAARLP